MLLQSTSLLNCPTDATYPTRLHLEGDKLCLRIKQESSVGLDSLMNPNNLGVRDGFFLIKAKTR